MCSSDLVFALTVVPAATAITFKSGLAEHKERWFDAFRTRYSSLVKFLLRHSVVTVVVSVSLVVVSIASLAWIGTEFMPRLDEGSILIETRKLPGISLTQSIELSNQIEKLIRSFPEVTSVVTKIGRPDLATEAMGIYQGDVYVLLKPYEEWPAGVDRKSTRLNSSH